MTLCFVGLIEVLSLDRYSLPPIIMRTKLVTFYIHHYSLPPKAARMGLVTSYIHH